MPAQPKRVVIAPLAWGLGHATRSVPVVKALLALKCKVWAVLTPPQQALYESIFGGRITYLPFEEPPVDYRGSFAVAMVRQMPRFSAQYKREQSLAGWLTEKVKPDLIISDNRYGFKHWSVPSVMIGHQLQLRAGVLSPLANAVNRRFMQGFDAIWVPDNVGQPNLSGALSHGKTPPNTRYIGPLSRLASAPVKGETKFDWLALLSGPEPQRTLLEDMLVEIAHREGFRLALMAGQPEKGSRAELHDRVARYPHCSDEALMTLISQSQGIVCRSGYSTLCDLAALGRKALLIPTPGQTEQQYLAQHFHRSFGFPSVKQSPTAVTAGLKNSKSVAGAFEFSAECALETVLREKLSL